VSEPDGRPIEAEELVDEAVLEDVDAEALELDIDRLVAEKDEYRDLAQRVQAEFENYRKRMLREQTETMERASESIVAQLLPVLDNFELALASLDAADDKVRKGVELLYAELLDVLAKAGLERIDALARPFDPNEHEAVAQEDGDGEPVVNDVLRAGYRLKGRVLRPATVRVTRAANGT
jgi:molecular chaperone GrpE